MTGDSHVRLREGLGVKLPWVARPHRRLSFAPFFGGNGEFAGSHGPSGEIAARG